MYGPPPTNSPKKAEGATTPTLFATLDMAVFAFSAPFMPYVDVVIKLTPVRAFNPLRNIFKNLKDTVLGTPNSTSIDPASPKNVSGSAKAFSSYAFCNSSCNFVSNVKSGIVKAKSKTLYPRFCPPFCTDLIDSSIKPMYVCSSGVGPMPDV